MYIVGGNNKDKGDILSIPPFFFRPQTDVAKPGATVRHFSDTGIAVISKNEPLKNTVAFRP